MKTVSRDLGWPVMQNATAREKTDTFCNPREGSHKLNH